MCSIYISSIYISVVYQQALLAPLPAPLSPPRRCAVNRQQRHWVRGYPGERGDRPGVSVTSVPADSAPCFTPSYLRRLSLSLSARCRLTVLRSRSRVLCGGLFSGDRLATGPVTHILI